MKKEGMITTRSSNDGMNCASRAAVLYSRVLRITTHMFVSAIYRLAHQIVQLWIFAEERLVFSLLLMHKVFDVHVKAGRRDAFRSLCGLLTLLKQQRQQGEQWMSVDAASTVWIGGVNTAGGVLVNWNQKA